MVGVFWYTGMINYNSFAGKSRSTTIVCAYLMKKLSLTANESLDLIKK